MVEKFRQVTSSWCTSLTQAMILSVLRSLEVSRGLLEEEQACLAADREHVLAEGHVEDFFFCW